MTKSTEGWAIRCVYLSGRPGKAFTGPSTPTPEESTRFCAALGRALAEWQFIESGLVTLFEHAVAGGFHQGAALAFHVPQGFRVRLDMCTAAISKSGAPEAWQERWKTIAKKLAALASARNSSSHGLTVFDATRPAGRRLFVVSNLNHPNKRPDVFDQSVGEDEAGLHLRAREYFAAYEELAAYSSYFGVAVRDKFPDGGKLPPLAAGQMPTGG